MGPADVQQMVQREASKLGKGWSMDEVRVTARVARAKIACACIGKCPPCALYCASLATATVLSKSCLNEGTLVRSSRLGSSPSSHLQRQHPQPTYFLLNAMHPADVLPYTTHTHGTLCAPHPYFTSPLGHPPMPYSSAPYTPSVRPVPLYTPSVHRNASYTFHCAPYPYPCCNPIPFYTLLYTLSAYVLSHVHCLPYPTVCLRSKEPIRRNMR